MNETDLNNQTQKEQRQQKLEKIKAYWSQCLSLFL